MPVEIAVPQRSLLWVPLTPNIRTDVAPVAASSANSKDLGPASSNGGVLWVLLSGFAGTSVTLAVNDSADNSVFAAVAGLSVTLAAAPAWARIQLGSGTLRQFVAIASSGTFSSAAFQAEVSR